ncbi:type II toxin-antitoxin system RelE/ParE family toxin [Scytonema sp. UIC 10036]|uniref:type II toxin-antitoxin system RelE/ParE family toxin n=1 Tax=Scytonema sp. UIC 10036 TaxID=2304196 RepID=UPI0012DA06FB|nr:type II toxin-antitoxin system RelE/ParE family toxin [Scytonema sp. UIC 10036]MUH01464.1 type II toxin-antitoxin system RelE/ParE family toxin [Scytonema sp. UIC 10036]
MTWEVEFTNEFEAWWVELDGSTQVAIDAVVRLLEVRGPELPFPYSSKINSSRHSHMRELRVQHKGEPYRVLYAFEPRRTAILLLGGNKGGEDSWYEENVPKADKLYDEHLEELKTEGFL